MIGGWLGYFLGGCDGLLYALVLFVVADYLTGVMCAVNDKKLSSEVGFRGICRKVLIFILVGIANIVDQSILGTGCVMRTAIIFFYISNEGISLLENAKQCADGNAGYSVFDEQGKVVYAPGGGKFEPYMVRVKIPDLNIRTGPGTDYEKTGKYTGIGAFTIVEESDGAGSDAGWGD